MLNYQLATSNIISLLDSASSDLYVVAGYKKQAVKSNNNNFVQVICISGKNINSGTYSPIREESTVIIKCYSSARAKMDLSSLSNPDITTAQRMAIFNSKVDAEQEADRKVEQVYESIFNTLNNKLNRNLGLDEGFLQKGRIIKREKTNPIDFGKDILICIDAYYRFECDEYADGSTPIVPAAPFLEVTTEYNANDDSGADNAIAVVDIGD